MMWFRQYKLQSGAIIVPLILIALLAYGCTRGEVSNAIDSGTEPAVSPSFSGVTIPFNIAPLNFRINEQGRSFYVTIYSEKGERIKINSSTGKISIPEKKWRRLLTLNKEKDISIEIFSKGNDGKWKKFIPVTCHISPDPIDPFIYYRMLYPGYESWSELFIECRSTGSFKAHPFLKNRVADNNCINCHSLNNGKSDNFLFHMRGSHAGTYYYSEGRFSKINHKIDELNNGAVYPCWHPSGKYVAFSSNMTRQRFHAAGSKKVDVSDLESCLVLYDVGKNELMKIEVDSSGKYMDTFPEWSSDGKYLYFCRAPGSAENFDYTSVRYDLCRVSFDESARQTGIAELVLKADSIGKSISFPRISPDGRFMIITLADYGCFPIWHREADLYSLNLSDKSLTRLDLNSNLCDSYHSWSSNGRWLIFSSKRDDGLTALPYIAHVDINGKTGKPFILPQEDAEFYNNNIKTFNVPEFSMIDLRLRPGKARRLAESEARKAVWSINH